MTQGVKTRRPLSVTVIAWFFIVTSLLMCFFLLYGWNDPDLQVVRDEWPYSRNAYAVWVVLTAWIGIGCAIGLLIAQNWARLVIAGTELLGFVLSISQHEPSVGSTLVDALLLAIGAYFLFSRRADAFFGRRYLKSQSIKDHPEACRGT